MGYTRHHAIIVTGYDLERVEKIRNKIKKKCTTLRPTRVHVSAMEGYGTFFIGPDGSKEGWPDSDAGDEERNMIINLLRSKRFEDGSSPFDWVEVQYGDDNGEDELVRSCSG